MFSYSKFENESNADFFKLTFPMEKDYSVQINGEDIPVYFARISKYPFNVWWQGHQRPVTQSEVCSYINLVGDEEITLTVKARKPHSRVLIKPYSAGVVAKEEDGVITFTLKTNGNYVLELDDYHGLLYIFYSKPIVCDSPETVTHYFGPGVHYPRQINLKSGDRVYVDKDALVYGCLYAEGAEDIEIFGNGILDDSGEERFDAGCYKDSTIGNMKFYDCKNIRIRGVGMTNSAIWCLNIFHCTDVLVDGIKIFGQWRYNTDGIDAVNSQNITIKNSFVHSFDDTIVIKGIKEYCHTSCKNIHVENCVLWCDWGKTCELGVETACAEYENISFVNCDVLRAGNTVCDIANGYTAYIHNVRFENIRAEFNRFDTPEQLQKNDDSVYSRQNEVSIPFIINIFKCRFSGCSCEYDTHSGDAITENSYKISDVVCKNLSVYYDEGIPLKDGKPIIKVGLKNLREDGNIENITIENIVCNGKRLGEEDITWEIKSANNNCYKFS